MSGLKSRIGAGEFLVGSFISIPHPVSVEVMADAGLDFLCLDGEHAQIGRERLEELLRAADSRGVPALVRVPGHAPEAIAAALDAGAAGVVVPRVSTASQARAAVDAALFPPRGRRGAGPGRAARYGYDIADYIARANEKVVVAVQVETAEGVDAAEEIASVEGVDLVFIGPGDLAVSLGALAAEGAGRLDAAIRSVIAACRRAGRPVGLFRPGPDDLGDWRGEGVHFFVVASDAMLLGGAARALAAHSRGADA